MIITVLHGDHLSNQCHQLNVLKRNFKIAYLNNFKSIATKPISVKAHIICWNELITGDVEHFVFLLFPLVLFLSPLSFVLHILSLWFSMASFPTGIYLSFLYGSCHFFTIYYFASFLFSSCHYVVISFLLCIFCASCFLPLLHHVHGILSSLRSLFFVLFPLVKFEDLRSRVMIFKTCISCS